MTQERRYGRALTVALAAVLGVLIAAAGAAGWAMGREVPGSAVVIVTADAGEPGGTVPARSPSTGEAGAPLTASDPLTTPVASGAIQVELSPSAENAIHAREVADLITRYFTAINRHDYDAWLSTVSIGQSKRDRDSWLVDYSTTHDSEVYISDINPGDPLTVRMQFVSHQSLEFAPAALPASCVRWDVTYEILDEGVGLRVGTSAKEPALAPC